jgi:phosphoribosylformimino-5-aminoimidazole carboxamide ribotide isomerase
MELIPAIPVLYNKVAVINNYNVNDVRVYGLEPLETAMRMENAGIKRVHVIDLDGVKTGRMKNTGIIEGISGFTDLKIDFGGGVTSDDDFRLSLEYGADRIHSAHVPLHKPELFAAWLISFGPSRLIMSLDVAEGKVLSHQPAFSEKMDALELVEDFVEKGLQFIKLNQIHLSGGPLTPGYTLYKEIQQRFPSLKIIAAGGIMHIDDLKRLRDEGIYAAVFARALFEEKIKWEELEQW